MSSEPNTIKLPIQLTPDWIAKNHVPIRKRLSKSDVSLNCIDLQSINSLGIAFIADLQRVCLTTKQSLTLLSLAPDLEKEFARVPQSLPESTTHLQPNSSTSQKLGEGLVNMVQGLRENAHLFTESFYWSTLGLFKKKTLLKGSTVQQMIVLGSSALPIVLLLSFLIGLTLAIQSAVQLEKFGASIYLASGIGISMVTEIGPMMTAIIIAGRSGSAITAEISTMVVQEELRALKTMGINPIHFILLPRFWALTLMLPLLTICSDVIGITAGLLVSYLYCKVPIPLFFSELEVGVSSTMIIQSMLKTVVFAWIITLISVYKGLNTHGGADAVGKSTTSCVVTCLFTIILADALFSFVFYF